MLKGCVVGTKKRVLTLRKVRLGPSASGWDFMEGSSEEGGVLAAPAVPLKSWEEEILCLACSSCLLRGAVGRDPWGNSQPGGAVEGADGGCRSSEAACELR